MTSTTGGPTCTGPCCNASASHHRSTRRRRRRETAVALARADDRRSARTRHRRPPCPRHAQRAAARRRVPHLLGGPSRRPRSPSCSASPTAPCASSSPGPATTSGGSSMPDQDLDTRIRDLVARAVADAPRRRPSSTRPCRVTEPSTGPPPLVDRRRRRRPRRRGGRRHVRARRRPDDGRRRPRPATRAADARPTGAATTSPPTDVALDRAVDHRHDRRRRRSSPRAACSPPARTASSSTAATRPRTLTDRADGDRPRRRRRADHRPAPAVRRRGTTRRRSCSAPDGSLTELFDTADWDGAVELHDVEIVGGRRLLLFSLADRRPGHGPVETLYVVDLRHDASAPRSRRPSAAGECRHRPAAPGGHRPDRRRGVRRGQPQHPDRGRPRLAGRRNRRSRRRATCGLDESYRDCTDCPHALHRDARRPGDRVDQRRRRDARRPTLDQPVGDVEPLVAVPDGPVDRPRPRRRRRSCSFSGEPAPAPVVVPFDGSGPITLDGVDGDAATADVGRPRRCCLRRCAATRRPRRPRTGAAPAGVMLATAGADGVAVIENGVEVRRLDQPAEIALLDAGRRGHLPAAARRRPTGRRATP